MTTIQLTIISRKSWGYRRNMAMEDVFSIEELLKELAITVSCGGNLLMNVGPNKDGVIVPIFEERLRQTGQWLRTNGEAIYSSRPWSHQNDSVNPDVWYTSKVLQEEGQVVYGILLSWPKDGKLSVASPIPGTETKVTLLGHEGGPLDFKSNQKLTSGMTIDLPNLSNSDLKWAWVLKFDHLENGGNTIPRANPF